MSVPSIACGHSHETLLDQCFLPLDDCYWLFNSTLLFLDVQINKVQSINPAISVSGHSRMTPTAVTSTTPGLTTVVVTGTAGPTAYVSQSVNASRIVKNYPPVIGYQPSVPSTTQLSASSILADTKKHQQQQQQSQQQQHSVVVQQQQPQITGSNAGNVIVVHRGLFLSLELS